MFHLEIDLEHIKNDREALHDVITKSPGAYMGMMELGARDFLLKTKNHLGVSLENVPPVQITFTGQLPVTPIRNITVRQHCAVFALSHPMEAPVPPPTPPPHPFSPLCRLQRSTGCSLSQALSSLLRARAPRQQR